MFFILIKLKSFKKDFSKLNNEKFIDIEKEYEAVKKELIDIQYKMYLNSGDMEI